MQPILQRLREWIETELKLGGYEHKEILNKIDELYKEQAEQGIEKVPIYKAFSHDGLTYDSKDYQIEKLTNALNLVIDKLK